MPRFLFKSREQGEEQQMWQLMGEKGERLEGCLGHQKVSPGVQLYPTALGVRVANAESSKCTHQSVSP